ncbi:MAG TPA: c-type cytochrome [Acidimicrobiales bacterium]|nr:c-type cytochrome [Acidimicrobiales bacterium]
MSRRRQLYGATALIGLSFALAFLFFGVGARADTTPAGSSGTGNTGYGSAGVGTSAGNGAGATQTGQAPPAGPASGRGALGRTGGTPYSVNSLTPEQLSGQVLFEQNCSSCHGVSAEGSSRAPTLAGLGAATVDFWVSTGRMPLEKPAAQVIAKPPLFSDKQSREIAEYVASLAPGGVPIPTVDTANANLQDGGELFRLNCATCHSFTASGGALSYGAFAPSLQAATPQVLAEAIRTGPGNMPRFSTAQLSNSDMNDIIKYVKYVTSPEDRGGFNLGHIGPTVEGFIGIGVGVGLLMVAAFWIGERAA